LTFFKPANDRQQGFAHSINACNHLKDDSSALFGLLIDEPEYPKRWLYRGVPKANKKNQHILPIEESA